MCKRVSMYCIYHYKYSICTESVIECTVSFFLCVVDGLILCRRGKEKYLSLRRCIDAWDMTTHGSGGD